jgi:hypothetical protein
MNFPKFTKLRLNEIVSEFQKKWDSRYDSYSLLLILFAGLFVLGLAGCHTKPVDSTLSDTPTKESTTETGSGSSSKIVNGEDAPTGNKSKSADLSRNIVAVISQQAEGTALCTGSILTDDMILTAAHCVDNNPQDIRIFFGRELLKEGSLQEQNGNVQFTLYEAKDYDQSSWRKVLSFTQNSKWKRLKDQGLGDLAILHFTGGLPGGFEPVTFAPRSWIPEAGIRIRMLGYGVTNGLTHEGSGVLRQTDSEILSSLSKTQVESDGRQTSVCFGDSGGPAFVEYNGEWVQWGVASSVTNSACNQSSIHTTVMSYETWMNKTMDHLRTQIPGSQDAVDSRGAIPIELTDLSEEELLQ